MIAGRPVRRPGGAAPPVEVMAPGGGSVDVRVLAEEVARRYFAEVPEDRDRYGDLAVAWCVHDNQHILQWALLDAQRLTSLHDQVRWLAGILRARGFPVAHLRRDLELCADVVEASGRAWAPEVARRLRDATSAAVP